MKHDLMYALRGMSKKPFFTVAAVLTLALGMGANSAIFSVVNAVLLRPLPYPSPGRLMMLWTYNPRQGFEKDVSSYPNFDDWRRRSVSFDRICAYFDAAFALTQAGDPVEIRGAMVTPGFFETLGVAPALGRAFTPREGTGGNPVAILSHALWQARFGSDSAVVGRTIMLNGVAHEVVGVMPASFAYPEKAEVWTPLAPSGWIADVMQARDSFWLHVVGRLKPGVTRGQAQAEMDAIASALERQYPDANTGIGVRVVPMHEEIVGDVRRPLLILLGAVAFVLLIACANVANLLLTRAASRQKELAIRTALGAGRSRLIRQMLIESLVLSVAGGVAGLLLAAWAIRVLLSLAPSELPRLSGVSIDPAVILYTSLAVLVTALIFGTAPALQSTAVRAGQFLQEGGRSGSEGSRGRRLRSVVAVVEIAVALVLLSGAGLLVRSFLLMNRVDLGFDPRNILALRLTLPDARYPEGTQVMAFYDDLASRLRALPGVESVGLGSSVLLPALPQSATLSIQGRPPQDRALRNPPVPYDSITSDYFKTLRIPLLRGRLFTDADTATAQRVVIVNESLTRRFFPDGNALGKNVAFGNPTDPRTRWATIVGIVRDTRRGGVDRPPWAEVYYPLAQAPDPRMYVLIRTSGDPLALARSAHAQVWAIDRNQPIQRTTTIDGLLAVSQANRRFTTLLLGIFSIVALVLAGIGIYGVVAYSTAQRTREIGVRMALGARPADVLRLVVGEGARMAAGGVVIGVAASLAVTRLMSTLLFGIPATDPITFAGVAVLLTFVALLASTIPALRATRVSPQTALHGQ